MSIKLVNNFQINIFLILMIIIKYIPLQVSTQYFHIPEILSLVIYIIYLLKKNILSSINILTLSLFDDFLKLHYISTTMQNLIYIFYVDYLRKKYPNSILFDWLLFTIFNIFLLTFKYIIMNVFQRHNILTFALIFKKVFITILLFPLIYYLVNNFFLKKQDK